MSIVITGDTHGTFDIEKVVRYFNEHEDEYTRDDYLIICGDVGICGFSAAYEANTRAVFRSLPVTTAELLRCGAVERRKGAYH